MLTKMEDHMEKKHSTSFAWFISKCNQLYTNIQLTDVAICKVTKILEDEKQKDSTQLICDALGCNRDQYTKLKSPIAEYSEFVSKVRSDQAEFAIRQLYGYFANYLQNILSELYPYKPYLISQLNDDNASKQHLTYKEIIELQNYDNITKEIINRIFRAMENKRDTAGLIDKIIKSFKINVSDEITKKALCYFELRHLLVHHKGLADGDYVAKFKDYYKKQVIQPNKRIRTTYEVYRNAQSAIHKLCETIDSELYRIITIAQQE